MNLVQFPRCATSFTIPRTRAKVRSWPTPCSDKSCSARARPSPKRWPQQTPKLPCRRGPWSGIASSRKSPIGYPDIARRPPDRADRGGALGSGWAYAHLSRQATSLVPGATHALLSSEQSNFTRPTLALAARTAASCDRTGARASAAHAGARILPLCCGIDERFRLRSDPGIHAALGAATERRARQHAEHTHGALRLAHEGSALVGPARLRVALRSTEVGLARCKLRGVVLLLEMLAVPIVITSACDSARRPAGSGASERRARTICARQRLPGTAACKRVASIPPANGPESSPRQARRSGLRARSACVTLCQNRRPVARPVMRGRALRESPQRSSTYAATNGNTIVASDSITKRGVSTASLPQVIFSPGGAPLYEP